MTNVTNKFSNVRIEFHILQSFPVTCLNRDDVGAPKTAVVGGVTRARVSSQCWKRQVRLAMQDFGVSLGARTKLISTLIKNACLEEGATEEQASKCGEKIEQVFIKKSDGEKDDEASEEGNRSNAKTDTLLFLSKAEAEKFAKAFKEKGFNPEEVIRQKEAKKQAKEVEAILGKPNYSLDGLDIALFGRMVAQAANLNVEAAASFSHAISTHKVTNEVEFFTALDDFSEEQGSAHMGSLEFNSATYYRYIDLDLGQLYENLGGESLFPKAIEAFIKALYIAVPSARQTTQAGASVWDFAKIYVRKGQRLQLPCETPVKSNDGGFLKPSIDYVKNTLDKKEKLSGSLFGKIAEFTFGEDESFSIDDLVSSVIDSVVE
ncbi:MAG TPA: type I-E CRISPR-associated protein Cas7/Cse4/CasC [Spirochaetales bacterium]|nr:type I-E CRISPR-associated protein Cas7/Cse4/CasC [Spirochaetales bacterium]